MRITEWIIIQP